ncbi:MAG TPA: hypothetical protein VK021_08015 [Flavobacteriaceae bacterium]|nr:hypothetical protein [Flavobacteriaceae bacterium]
MEKSKQHSKIVRKKLQEVIDMLREEIPSTEDDKAKALYETSAEVLIGVKTAFAHFEEGEEEAWK